jgi:plasmid stabilization system protein ParE
MPQVIYSERARSDLIRIYGFQAQHDKAVALRALAAIEAAIRGLSLAPKLYRVVDDGLREIVIDFGSSGFLALYGFDEVRDRVVVFAIRHQKEKDYPGVGG